MQAMKKKKYFIFVFFLFVALSASLGIYIYEKNKTKREQWSNTVRDFKDCDLTTVLWGLGKKDLQNVYGLSPHLKRSYDFDQYSKLIIEFNNQRFSKNQELKTVWLDPERIDSLSSEKTTENSISFFDQCNKLVKEGKFEVGINLAYFYLFNKFVNSKELIEGLAKNGVVDAYVLLGHSYRNGLLNSVNDEKKAFESYLKASNEGSSKGMSNVAEMFFSVDKEKSKQYILAAAEEGSLIAIYQLQDIYGKYRFGENLSNEIKTNDVKVLYFWNLIFNSVYKFHKEIGSYALDFSKSSPFLKEEESGPIFDGVPQMQNVDNAIVNYFDLRKVEANKNSLEGMLNTDERIQVQKKATEWLVNFEKRYKTKFQNANQKNEKDIKVLKDIKIKT